MRIEGDELVDFVLTDGGEHDHFISIRALQIEMKRRRFLSLQSNKKSTNSSSSIPKY
jgi:hypothetical protein